MDIALVFDKNQKTTTGFYCKRALEKLGHRITHYGVKERVIRPYDLVLKIDDGSYYPFKVMPWHTTAYWAIDTHTVLKRIVDIARRADYVFSAQKNGVDLLREQGVRAHWLPLAGEIPPVQGKVEKIYDVAFIGGMRTEKRKRIEKIVREFTGRVYIGAAPPEDIPVIYKSAFIGINTLAGNDINMRTFEVTINGALLLMEKIDDNGMDDLFADGTEFIRYDDEEDLRKKLPLLLKNRESFDRVIKAGQARALNEHTYEIRMKRLVEHINEARLRAPITAWQPFPKKQVPAGIAKSQSIDLPQGLK